MWIKDCNIGLWILLLVLLGVQRNFISDYGSRYPDAMSIGDSMRFSFVIFLMTA